MASSRILSKSVAEAAWASLTRTWDIPPGGDCWFPLSPTASPAVIAFEAPAFYAALGAEWLRSVLAARGVERVLHFPELDRVPPAEVPLAEAAFRYEGLPGEGYWCDAGAERKDWLVYASHEGSVTLGGAWLLTEAQRTWPAWDAHLWNNSTDSYRPAAT